MDLFSYLLGKKSSGGGGGGDFTEYFNESITGGQNYTTVIKKIPAIGNTGTSCSEMFYNCKATEIDLSNFDTTNVTTMYHMFMSCNKLTSLDMNDLNTSKVTDFASMFDGCSSLTTLKVNFDVSKATTMYGMFGGCSGLTSLDLSNWEFNENNCQAGLIFYGCSHLEHLDLRNATMSRTYGSSMFTNVPTDCEIIVKDNTQKTWFSTNYPSLTNVKTVAEYEA